jgi:hypothetical protein
MTPKERAIDLYNKFYDLATVVIEIRVKKYVTKQCALIAVDEIISEFGTYYKINIDDKYVSYWEKVKQEIENL